MASAALGGPYFVGLFPDEVPGSERSDGASLVASALEGTIEAVSATHASMLGAKATIGPVCFLGQWPVEPRMERRLLLGAVFTYLSQTQT